VLKALLVHKVHKVILVHKVYKVPKAL